jgi:hypothetical protein
MPKLEAFFHYRNLDVSTLKELARRWKPEVLDGFKKAQAHTALADIHESSTNCCTTAAPRACRSTRPVASQSSVSTFRTCAWGAVLLQQGDDGPARTCAKAMGLRVVDIVVDPQAPAGRFSFAGPRPVPPAVPEPGAPADVALLLHTSGTTARPKIVPLTHRNLSASARNIAQHLSLTPQDRCLNVMPLFHIHGLVGALLASIAAGGSVVCCPRVQRSAVLRLGPRVPAYLVHGRADHPSGRRCPVPAVSAEGAGPPVQVHPVVFVVPAGSHDEGAGDAHGRARDRGLQHDRGRAPDDQQRAASGHPACGICGCGRGRRTGDPRRARAPPGTGPGR